MRQGGPARRGGDGSGAPATSRRPAGGRGRVPPPGGRRPPPPPPARQVAFDAPLPERARVAVIGGGAAGISCATELGRLGMDAVVFDTGEHGVGGRLATRAASDGSLGAAWPRGAVFDHAAQFFTAGDPAFAAQVEVWAAAGAVRRWDGPVGWLERGAFSPLPAGGPPRWVAAGGFRALAEHAAAGLEVRRPVWVSSARATPSGWRLAARGADAGAYDAVVIAHNGKCANRLSQPMGSPGVHATLRRLKLSAVWVVMAAFESPLRAPGGAEGAFVRGPDGVLAWAANNTKKLGLGGAGGGGALDCWTLVSTPEYGRANKVPQEAVPPAEAARVTAEMVAAFGRALGVEREAPAPAFTRAQLWGAALPLNTPRLDCVWDGAARVGVCGDWVAGGGSLQAAWVSGVALAHRVGAARGLPPAEAAAASVGLAADFFPAAGEAIGQFPAPPGG